MYVKLALKNIRRNSQNYIICFLTIFLTVMLMYTYIVLATSNDILVLAENINMLAYIGVILSILVAFISCFIMKYAVSFILNQRKKEIAIYLLLGMDRKIVCKLFLMENFMMGFIALVLGICVGSGLSGFLVKLIFGIFGKFYNFTLNFSKQAISITIILTLLIYLSGIKKSVRIILNEKVIDLLYDNKKNEIVKKHYPIFRLIFGFVSVVLGSISIIIAMKCHTNNAIMFLIISVILFMFTIYQLYCLVPMIILWLMDRKGWHYKETNIFLQGQIRKKSLTSGRVMAVVAVLLSFSLSAMLIGLIMGMGYKVNVKAEYPYDVAVAIDTKIQNFDEVINFVGKRYLIQDSVTYYLYNDSNYNIDILSLSDYNRLREQLGLDNKYLSSTQYLVHCDTRKYADKIKKDIIQDSDIVLNGRILQGTAENIFTEPIELYRMAGTNGYVLVVPDEIVKGLDTNKSRLVISLANKGEEELRNSLNQFIRKEWNPVILEPVKENITMSVSVKAWGLKNSLSGFVTISFSGFYMCVIFIIFSATLLSFEQLSDLNASKGSYSILGKLGVSKQEQKYLTIKESANLFFVPLILPLIFVLVITGFAELFLSSYIVADNVIPLSLAVTLGIFGVIYSVYFMMTNYLYQRIILH